MFTLTVGFLQSLFSFPPSLLPVQLLYSIFLESTDTLYYRSLLFLEIHIISPADFHVFTVSIEFSILILKVNTLEQPDISLSSVSLMHIGLNRHISVVNLSPECRVETKTQTHHCTFQQGSRPDIIPQRARLY